jgi:hypothetical protein
MAKIQSFIFQIKIQMDLTTWRAEIWRRHQIWIGKKILVELQLFKKAEPFLTLLFLFLYFD